MIAPREMLGEYCYQVLPAERAETSFFHIPIAGASMILGANATSVDMLAAESGIKSAECLTHFLGFAWLCDLVVNKSTSGSGTHLAFCLFNQKGFAGTHKDGASLCTDGLNVSGNESVVCSGGNNGLHIKRVLKG